MQYRQIYDSVPVIVADMIGKDPTESPEEQANRKTFKAFS